MILVFYILIIAFSYFCLIIFFLYKWSVYSLKDNSVDNTTEPLTLLIPVHNDGENLEKLLEALSKQSLSPKIFEIIIIDDHSDVSPAEFLNSLSFKGLDIRLISNAYGQGKKYSLKTGVENANYLWIVCTDADCIAHKKWLETIQQAFVSHNPKLISAPVVMTHNDSLFQKFQSFEFSSLVASGAASIAADMPIMCNGANLAFQKELFLEAFPDLKPQVNSGDDIFLLEYTKRNYPEGIVFLKDRNAIVNTDSEASLSKFYKQRIRWTSKTLFYNDSNLILVSSLVFLYNFNIVLTSILSIVNVQFLYLVFVQYAVKSIADFLLLRNFLSFLQDKKLIRIFPFAQIIYPFYILSVSLMGIIKSFQFKYVKLSKK